MIITLSGAQGQGKTTILKHMEKKGYNVVYNMTARELLKKSGLTLDEIYSDSSLAMKFQDDMLNKQRKINKEYSTRNTITLMERSYADMFAYAMFAVGSLNKCSTWLNNYYSDCIESQKEYHCVIFLTGRNYTPKDDGVRSTNKLFGNSMDLVIEHNMREMGKYIDSHNRFIGFEDFYYRINAVENVIEEVTWQ